MTADPRGNALRNGSRGQFPEKSNWEVGEAAVVWLAATIGPALTFDLILKLEPELGASDMGVRFLAFFQVVCTALFLVLWARIGRFSVLLIMALVLVSAAFFSGYSILREIWTCQYFDEGRVVMGTPLLPDASSHLASLGLLDKPCLEQMMEFGGEGERMWPFWSLVTRFLLLFGLYALAWWSLALLVLAALFERRKRKKA